MKNILIALLMVKAIFAAHDVTNIKDNFDPWYKFNRALSILRYKKVSFQNCTDSDQSVEILWRKPFDVVYSTLPIAYPPTKHKLIAPFGLKVAISDEFDENGTPIIHGYSTVVRTNCLSKTQYQNFFYLSQVMNISKGETVELSAPLEDFHISNCLSRNGRAGAYFGLSNLEPLVVCTEAPKADFLYRDIDLGADT